MGGMRFKVNKHTYRKRGSADKPPTWYDNYYRGPESDGEEVFLGRSERLERHLHHRFYPVSGEWPQVFRGWTNGVEWLLECWRGAKAISDATRADEDEEVREE